MNKEYKDPPTIEIFGVIAVVATIATIIGSYIYYKDHPDPVCIETKNVEATCGGVLYCAVRDIDFNCIMWLTSDEYPCTRTVCAKYEDLRTN